MRLRGPLRDDVAVVVSRANSAEAGPQRVALNGRATRIRRHFRTNRIRGVDPLHDLSVADRHVGVGRSVGHAVVGEPIANSQEVRDYAVIGFWAVDRALFHRVYDLSFSGKTLGNPANRIRFMKTVLRRL